MSYQEVVASLKRAEDEVAQELAKASQNREYDVVSKILSVGQALRRLIEDLERQGSPPASKAGAAAAFTRSEGETSRMLSRSGKRYPVFSREGNDLVKTAWSKKNRSEYQHRCPWENCWQFFQWLENRYGGGRTFSMQDVVGSSPLDLPSYQLYLGLAWLRAEGLAEKHGRNEYAIVSNEFLNRVHERWEQLLGEEGR